MYREFLLEILIFNRDFQSHGMSLLSEPPKNFSHLSLRVESRFKKKEQFFFLSYMNTISKAQHSALRGLLTFVYFKNIVENCFENGAWYCFLKTHTYTNQERPSASATGILLREFESCWWKSTSAPGGWNSNLAGYSANSNMLWMLYVTGKIVSWKAMKSCVSALGGAYQL